MVRTEHESGTFVEVLADSIGPCETRLTTLRYRAPRFILAQINTHRAFSRNAASSRAILTDKLLHSIESNPFKPSVWRYAKSRSMQPGEPMAARDAASAECYWMNARDDALDAAGSLHRYSCAKETANRLLEPFMWVEGVISATEWDNFFALRDHGDAQHEIQVLARCMREALDKSTPARLKAGEWHMPYHDPECDKDLSEDDQRRVCVARLARATSYMNTREYSHAKDLRLEERLRTPPLHASPYEHIAQASGERAVTEDQIAAMQKCGMRPHLTGVFPDGKIWRVAPRSGNFTGWRQWRKIIEQEQRQ